METFKIEIQESLSKVVEIDANSAEEAISIIKELYKKEEIVLNTTDFTETKFLELDNS